MGKQRKRIIIIKQETYKKLALYKVKNDLRSFDQAIKKLLKQKAL